MFEKSEQERISRLEEENENLRNAIQELKSGKHSRLKSLRYIFSRKAAFMIIGKGLKNSLNKLYSELPNRVTRDTFADVSAHLIWRLTRVGTFAIIVGVTPLLILFLQTFILYKQNQLFQNQNEMFKSQLGQVDRQNELIDGQNNLILEQNRLFGLQNSKADLQNDLVSGQNSLVENQNDLFGSQNKLVEKQTDRIEQQTELLEAERRSSLVFLMSNILDKMDEELKDPYNTKRKLSSELIGRVSALSHSLKPYRYLKDDKLIDKPLSPERGQLLLSLTSCRLDTSQTSQALYTSTKFSRADLDEAYLRNAHLPGVILNNADMKKADLRGADFSGSFLKNAEMEEIQANDTKFRGAELTEARLRKAELKNADFTLATLTRADLSKAELEGAVFQDANLKKADLKKANLSNANLIDAVFKEADLEDVNLRNAFVGSENWFDKMEEDEVIGIAELRAKYRLEAVVVVDGVQVTRKLYQFIKL